MDDLKYDRAIKLKLGTTLFDAAITSIEVGGTFTFADKEQGQNKFTGKIVDAKRSEGDWFTFFMKKVV